MPHIGGSSLYIQKKYNIICIIVTIPHVWQLLLLLLLLLFNFVYVCCMWLRNFNFDSLSCSFF